MTETPWRFYTDEEFERKCVLDAEIMNNPNIFGHYARPYLRQIGHLEAFLEWAFDNQDKKESPHDL